MKISIKTEFLNEIDENEIKIIIKTKKHNKIIKGRYLLKKNFERYISNCCRER